MVEENAPESPDNTPQDEKPAAPRRRRVPRQTAPAAQADDQEATTPTPRRTTRRRPTAAAKDESGPAAAEPASEDKPKPVRRRRTVKPAADATPAGNATPTPEAAAASDDKPKVVRRRRTVKPAEADAATTPSTTTAPPIAGEDAVADPPAAPADAAEVAPAAPKRAARLIRRKPPAEAVAPDASAPDAPASAAETPARDAPAPAAEAEAPVRRRGELGAPARDPDEPRPRQELVRPDAARPAPPRPAQTRPTPAQTRPSPAPRPEAEANAPASSKPPEPTPDADDRPKRAAALVRPEPRSGSDASPRADRDDDAPAPSSRRRRRRGSGSGAASAVDAVVGDPSEASVPSAEVSSPDAPGAKAPDAGARSGDVPYRAGARNDAETPVADTRTTDDDDVAGPEAGADRSADGGADATGGAPRSRRRRRGTRGGAGLRRQTAEEAVAGIPSAPEISDDEDDEPEMSEVERPRPRRRPARDISEIDATPSDTRDLSFMHPSEREFANLLDYYQIKYLYEPRSFPLRWDGNRVVEMHTPDFYLTEYDQYFELTTMKQSLVTQKNRKLRHVHEMYPEVNIQLLYRRDLMRLMGKYGFGPLADVDVEGTERTLYTEDQVQDRVREIGRKITEDYAGQEPVLIGVLRGVVVFMADLMREIDLPVQIEFMEISHYGEEREEAIEVLRDVTTDIKGRPVIVIEDIVDTGLTLRYLLEHLESKEPSSVTVCCLLDKSVRRMARVPLGYVGFEIGDEFVIGYGLDYGGRYRNLPYIGVLQPQEPKAIPQR